MNLHKLFHVYIAGFNEMLFLSKVSTKEVKNIVGRYLLTNKIRSNSIISEFSRDENLLLHDDVQHIIIGDLEDFVNILCYCLLIISFCILL